MDEIAGSINFSHSVHLTRYHAKRVIQGILAGEPLASERLVRLEQAFHLWESCFRWVDSTSFSDFLLREANKRLMGGRLVNPLTAERKHQHRLRRHRTDPETFDLWLFEDETDYDLGANKLPQSVLDFLAEMQAVEQFAREVKTQITAQRRAARLRVCALEFALYLYQLKLSEIRSPSFRYNHLKRLLGQLNTGAYHFDPEAYLKKHPYPYPTIR